MTKEFETIVNHDISRCEEAIKNGNKNDWGELCTELRSKYSPIITGFGENLHTLFYDEDGSCRKANLGIMQQKLELFRAMGFKNVDTKNSMGVVYNNTNQVVTTITVTFQEAKEKVENMSALREEEISEILSKINELEQITKSSERKTKKWEAAKEILKWVADKGIDVAKVVLPLVLKVGE